MLTTCPECHTTFRVTQEHLGLRRGLVRCGTCSVVFNAYDSLLAELVAPPKEPEREEDSRLADFPEESSHAHEQPAQEPTSPPTMPADEYLETPTRPPASANSDPNMARVETADSGPPVVEETSESILLSELPTRANKQENQASSGRGRFLLKLLAALLLGGLLGVQLAIFLRADLAAALPATRPLLQAVCRPLGCEVALPRQLDKSAIHASALEHDAENKSRARLSLLLVNKGKQTQAWPHIVLTLTDVRDTPVAQRVFTPREYLAQGTRVEAGMAAGTEREIRLDLDTGTLAASGYALDLAYR